MSRGVNVLSAGWGRQCGQGISQFLQLSVRCCGNEFYRLGGLTWDPFPSCKTLHLYHAQRQLNALLLNFLGVALLYPDMLS